MSTCSKNYCKGCWKSDRLEKYRRQVDKEVTVSLLSPFPSRGIHTAASCLKSNNSALKEQQEKGKKLIQKQRNNDPMMGPANMYVFILVCDCVNYWLLSVSTGELNFWMIMDAKFLDTHLRYTPIQKEKSMLLLVCVIDNLLQ